MIQPDHIHPLTDFKRNTATFRRRLKKSGLPAVLTVEGRAELVVQDAGAYQKLLDALEHADAVEGVRRGLESIRQGKGRPIDGVFADLRRKHGLPAHKPRK